MGTKPEAIDLAEDRDRFRRCIDELDIAYPAAGRATTTSIRRDRRRPSASAIPLLVRPSYVLGGRGMGIVYDDGRAREALYGTRPPRSRPITRSYLDRFLEGAVECDLDALCDGNEVYVGAIMEHIEDGGHPLRRLGLLHAALLASPMPSRHAAARPPREAWRWRLGVVGLVNIQFAIKDQDHLHDRGQPARQPHRALRLEGHGRAPGPGARPASWRARASPICTCPAMTRRLDHY